MKVAKKSEIPNNTLLMFGKSATAVRLTPTIHRAADDKTAFLYEGRKNREE
jgi:hypothetical protein